MFLSSFLNELFNGQPAIVRPGRVNAPMTHQPPHFYSGGGWYSDQNTSMGFG